MIDFQTRSAFAIDVSKKAGSLAVSFFQNLSEGQIEQKGAQDWVSEADKAVEAFIRERLSDAFPEDGIYGEEDAPKRGTSGFDWVIDPIDGTTNFVNGIPNWTIVLAGVEGALTQIGVIHDPMMNETFSAQRGAGAALNGASMSVNRRSDLSAGTVAVGFSNRVEATNIVPVVAALLGQGAMFHRNASGALSLAYVAAGRLLGYMEEHMNAWDCLAGQLLIAEAGGTVEAQDAQDMIADGGRVLVGAPQVFETLKAIADDAWGA